MRVLLTGASGAVGTHTIREILERGVVDELRLFDLRTKRSRAALSPWRDRVEVCWGDLRDPDDVARAAEGVDVAIHLGAIIPPLADQEPELAEQVNVGGTRNLVEALRQASPEAMVVYSSSISVYGDRVSDPWIEVGDPLHPCDGDHYAMTKLRGERLVQESGLRWVVFRLTGIMAPDMSMDPLMFHMPLDTRLEILTRRDTGLALARAAECGEVIEGRIFNLGGGASCRTTFREYLDRHMEIAGLGAGFLPDEAFAEQNFHCGWYRDSDDLEGLLHFQRQSLDDLMDEVAAATPGIRKLGAKALRPIIRWWLLRSSEPLHARKQGHPDLCYRFFGEAESAEAR